VIFATLNLVGQSNTQNATNVSLLNVGGGNQAIIQGAANYASVTTINVAEDNVVFNLF